MKLTFLFLFLSALSTLAVSSPVEKRATVVSTTTCMTQIRELQPSTPLGCIRFGRVERINGGSNINTLFALTMNPGFAGQKCTLNFINPSYLSGTKGVQLFTVGGPVSGSETWNSRPYRDQHVGTFTAVSSGSAVWTASYKRTFTCPSGGTKLYYEAVPTGDYDAVYWSLPNGLVVTVG